MTVQVSGSVTAITAGEVHACVRLGNDSVLGGGGKTFGQVGDGSITDRAAPRVILEGPGGSVPAEARPVIRSISASRDNTCVVRVNTLVSWWGDIAHGQLTDASA